MNRQHAIRRLHKLAEEALWTETLQEATHLAKTYQIETIIQRTDLNTGHTIFINLNTGEYTEWTNNTTSPTTN